MAVEQDPREWTQAQRTAVLAADLGELLNTVPTERSAWEQGPEETARRQEAAEEISDRMARVYEAGQG